MARERESLTVAALLSWVADLHNERAIHAPRCLALCPCHGWSRGRQHCRHLRQSLNSQSLKWLTLGLMKNVALQHVAAAAGSISNDNKMLPCCKFCSRAAAFKCEWSFQALGKAVDTKYRCVWWINQHSSEWMLIHSFRAKANYNNIVIVGIVNIVFWWIAHVS